MLIGIDASRAFVRERTGTENYSYHLIKNLLKLDRSNYYIIYIKRSGKVDFDLPANASVRVIPWPRLWTQGGLALETWLSPVDLLFIPAHTLPFLGRRSIPTLVTIHGLEYEYLPEYYRFPQKLYLTASTYLAVRYASGLVAVSSWTKRSLVRRLGADPKKIRVIHEGVEKNKFKVPASPAGRQSSKFKINQVLGKYKLKKPYLLFVGVIQPRKNLVRLIEAFSKLEEPSLSLVLAGRLGWMYDEIVAAPTKFGVKDKVHFLGYVPEEDLPALYQAASVFALPSLTEGFGLPVLEAMAAGTPVVAARAGALPEVVGEAGLLVNPLNPGELAGALSLVLQNPELAEGLREKGFKRAANFSWEKAAQKTVELFAKISGRE